MSKSSDSRRKLDAIPLAGRFRCGLVFLVALLAGLGATARAAEAPPAWATAYREKPMTPAEAMSFMRRLTEFVFDHHLKKNPNSPQRGMIYEYFDPKRQGTAEQFVQGEALDTMHDGAWFAVALVNAHRATQDSYYKDLLTRWVLPFYLKMLNHSDTLFSAQPSFLAPDGSPFGQQHAFQEGEKGFVPYWWDDGGSVSLERRGGKAKLPPFPCFDEFLSKNQPNPKSLLKGYSLGGSNHLAQDLGAMLQQAWLLLKDSTLEADRKMTAEIAEAAKNLHASRLRHHGHIPMVCAPTALANKLKDELLRLPGGNDIAHWTPANAYYQALHDFQPGERVTMPGFADDSQYRYYFGIARHAGKLPKPLAFRLIYDAFTGPMLYRCYSDDVAVPPGINRFDLHPYYFRDGKPEDYRSDRKGPSNQPRPIGSRFGPQNMVCLGWALQALRAYPGIWEERYERDFSVDLRVEISDWPPGAGFHDTVPPPPVKLDRVLINLQCTRTALLVHGQCEVSEMVVKFFSRPSGQGAHAVIVAQKDDKTLIATNHLGERLVINADVYPAGEGFRFKFELPFTVVKGQKPWMNAVEQGRCSIQIGKTTRNIYLASSETQLKVSMEHELGRGLRTWAAIFKEKGYVPTCLGAATMPGGQPWEDLSDVGGYAHLISAAAQWMLYLREKKDWEMHGVPIVVENE